MYNGYRLAHLEQSTGHYTFFYCHANFFLATQAAKQLNILVKEQPTAASTNLSGGR